MRVLVNSEVTESGREDAPAIGLHDDRPLV